MSEPTEPGWYLCDVNYPGRFATVALKWNGRQFCVDDAGNDPIPMTKKGVSELMSNFRRMVAAEPLSARLKKPEWHEWKCGDCQWSTSIGTYHVVKSDDAWRAYVYYKTVCEIRNRCESKDEAKSACVEDYTRRILEAFE